MDFSIFYFIILILTAFANGKESVYRQEIATDFKPKFTSSPSTTYLNRGESVRLNCSVDKLGDYALLWKKDVAVLSVDNRKLYSPTSGYHLQDDFSLEIKHVTDKLAGEYVCQITTQPEVLIQKHVVEIIRPPTIQKFPRVDEINLNSSETLKLTCKSDGNPKPSIIWTKDGNAIHDSQSGDMTDDLIISSISRIHSGRYECRAYNQKAIDATETFTVNVNYKPEVEVESGWVHSGEGQATDVVCTVYASRPIKEITWLYRGRNAKEHATVIVDSHDNSKHSVILKLHKVTKDDFGEYTCFAENTFGKASKTVRVSGLANQVTFTSHPQGIEPSDYRLSWSVQSYSDINEYNLRIRETKYVNNDYASVKIRATSSATRAPSFVHSQEYLITNLKEDTKYDVIIKAKNKFGWSRPSKVFRFTTGSSAYSSINPVLTNEVEAVKAEPHGGENGVDGKTSNHPLIPLIITSIITIIIHELNA